MATAVSDDRAALLQDISQQLASATERENAQQHSRTAPAAGEPLPPQRSIMCVPLVAHDQTVGLVYLDHTTEVGRFGKGELNLLDEALKQVGVGLQNMRLHQQAEEHARTAA